MCKFAKLYEGKTAVDWCRCDECRIETLGRAVRDRTVERDAAWDKIAQLEKDLDNTRRALSAARASNTALFSTVSAGTMAHLTATLGAIVAARQRGRDASQAVIGSLLRDREPGEPVPSLQGECSGAGTVTCDEVVRMVWRGTRLYAEGERGVGYSAVADAGRWLVLEHGPYTPQIAGVEMAHRHGRFTCCERNRWAAEAEIVRQVHAAKPLVKFVFEEDP